MCAVDGLLGPALPPDVKVNAVIQQRFPEENRADSSLPIGVEIVSMFLDLQQKKCINFKFHAAIVASIVRAFLQRLGVLPRVTSGWVWHIMPLGHIVLL